MSILKFLIFFDILSLIFSINLTLFSAKSPTIAISTAIWSICDEYFVKNLIKFDIYIYGESSSHLNDVVNGILMKNRKNFTVNIRNVKNIDNWNHKLNDAAVIFVRNSKNLLNFSKRIKLVNSYPKQLKILFYIEKPAKIIPTKLSNL